MTEKMWWDETKSQVEFFLQVLIILCDNVNILWGYVKQILRYSRFPFHRSILQISESRTIMQGKYMYMDRYFYSKATAPGPHQSYIYLLVVTCRLLWMKNMIGMQKIKKIKNNKRSTSTFRLIYFYRHTYNHQFIRTLFVCARFLKVTTSTLQCQSEQK
jgi:hypothetical protein